MVEVEESLIQGTRIGSPDFLKKVHIIQRIIGGTLDVLGTLHEGTIESGLVPASGTIGPQAAPVSEIGQETLGFNTNVGVAVNHELKIGDQWVTDGSDTVPTEGLVTTITHAFTEYRAVRTDPAGDATLTATYLGRN